MQADYLAMKGVTLLLDTIGAIQSQLNPTLRITGIVLTLADQRTGHTRQVVDLTRTTFAGTVPVFETLIWNTS